MPHTGDSTPARRRHTARSRGSAVVVVWEVISVVLVAVSVIPLLVGVFTNGIGWVLLSVACNLAGGLVLLSSRRRRGGP